MIELGLTKNQELAIAGITIISAFIICNYSGS